MYDRPKKVRETHNTVPTIKLRGVVVQYNHCPSLAQSGMRLGEAYYKDTNRKKRELGELAKELGPKWDGELLKSCCEMDNA